MTMLQQAVYQMVGHGAARKKGQIGAFDAKLLTSEEREAIMALRQVFDYEPQELASAMQIVPVEDWPE